MTIRKKFRKLKPSKCCKKYKNKMTICPVCGKSTLITKGLIYEEA